MFLVGNVLERVKRAGQSQFIERRIGGKTHDRGLLSLPTESPDSQWRIEKVRILVGNEQLRPTTDAVIVEVIGIRPRKNIGIQNRFEQTVTEAAEYQLGCNHVGP